MSLAFPLAVRVRRLLARLAHAIVEFRSRQRAILQLQALNDHILHDIGVSRCEIPSLVQARARPCGRQPGRGR